ncbi:MAG: STAS domain-containing protein [Rhodothermales bacterium]|nr:STAS domain-containing protein [Rhodothermales bacterium]
MLEIIQTGPSDVRLRGRFDATQQQAAFEFFDELEGPQTVHFDDLEYISSAGLSVLLHTQKRLSESGDMLKLRGLSPHVRLVFEYAGFDMIFDIE